MAEPVTTALAAAAIAKTVWNVGSKIWDNSQQKKARNARRSFFKNNIQSLLDDATQVEPVDFDAIRDAEMRMPTINMQNQMTNISRNQDVSTSRSGFVGSGFIESDVNRAVDNVNETFQAQKFGVDRGIMDMQTQLNDMVKQNKLRAKELEYQYKYG